MLIQTVAAGGPRNIYDETIMADHYDHPGLSFEHKAGHDHPVAECRKDVGEALIERYPGVERADEPTDDAQDSQDAMDTAAAESAPTGADGDANEQPFNLETLPHVGPATAGTLVDVGFGTPDALRAAEAGAVAGTVTGLSESDVAEMQAALDAEGEQ